jgi:hypothetical protein
MKFSTYPPKKAKKTWKTGDFPEVIHIIHIKTPVFGGLFL